MMISVDCITTHITLCYVLVGSLRLTDIQKLQAETILHIIYILDIISTAVVSSYVTIRIFEYCTPFPPN